MEEVTVEYLKYWVRLSVDDGSLIMPRASLPEVIGKLTTIALMPPDNSSSGDFPIPAFKETIQ